MKNMVQVKVWIIISNIKRNKRKKRMKLLRNHIKLKLENLNHRRENENI